MRVHHWSKFNEQLTLHFFGKNELKDIIHEKLNSSDFPSRSWWVCCTYHGNTISMHIQNCSSKSLQLAAWKTIYKIRNTETGSRMRRIQGTRRIFTRISRSVIIILTFLGMSLKISGKVQKYSRECSRRFPKMVEKVLGNDVQEESGECY